MNTGSFLFAQLLTQSPALLVYIGAIVACAIFWRRCWRAALLAMIGAALMLFSTLSNTLAISYLMGHQSGSASQTGAVLQIIYFGVTLVRALGLALVIAAVFVDRKPRERGFDVSMALPVNETELSPENSR